MRTGTLAGFWIWLLAVVIGGFPVPGKANPVEREHTTAELVSAATAVRPGESFLVGLRLTPLDGWHTYWRNPGDSGMPTMIEWDLPEGVAAGPVIWPGPERVVYGPLVNFGYKGPVTLLTRITIADDVRPGDSLRLGARADWLVCDDICVPEDADLAIILQVTDTDVVPDNRGARIIATAEAAVPPPVPWPAHFAIKSDILYLTIRTGGLDPDDVSEAFFFPYPEGVILNAPAQTLRWRDGALVLAIERDHVADIDQLGGVLRLDGAGVAHYEIVATPADAKAMATIDAALAADPAHVEDGANAASGPGITLWQAFLFAFLGGVILNLMPCVFPVLSLKALSIAARSGQNLREVRFDTLAFTLGVLASFAVVAGALIVVRAGGELVGWGFQLQAPIVVIILAYVLFGVGLNLSGVFAVNGRFAGLGQTLAARPGRGGAFFTGVLATVVATPCTAPFMAGAIGFALVQPAAVTFAIFLALGLGLAAPFIAFSLVPALHRRLPRPGPWMETLKQVLAFPMYGAAAWLIWVLSLQAGPDGLAAGLAGLVLIALAAWAYGRTQSGAGRGILPARVVAAGALVMALALAGLPHTSGPQTTGMPGPSGLTSANGPVAESWAPETVAALRAEGRPVFVNFTAAWCITCLVNERVALSSARVSAEFERRGIVYLKADWTSRNPGIAAELERHGRSGVPLYLLYPADAGQPPVLLPQILTETMVLDEIRRVFDQDS